MWAHERTGHAGQRPARILGWLAVVAALSAAALLCGAVGTRADDAPPLIPGAKVRVRAGTRVNPRIGNLIALDDTALTMRLGAREAPAVIHRSEITGVDVSAGRHSRWHKALIGAGIGAGAGALLGLASGNDSADEFIRFTAGEKALGGAILLASVGGLIGVALTPGEKWKSVEPGGLRLGLGANPGRGVTVSFTAGW